MIPLTQEYEVRFIELNGLRNIYIPMIVSYMEQWNLNHVPWVEHIEEAFEWMLEEAIERRFRRHVMNHFPSDLGKHLWSCFPGFELDIENSLSSLNLDRRRDQIDHIKVMAIGNLLIVATLFK